jgi:2-C-methyl-D-erythritol 4-phosphate cytidylyltransferase
LTLTDRYWLAIPAAGSGRRFGGARPKQYSEIAGATLIEHALRPFQQDRRCAGIAIAVAADDPWWQQIKQRWPVQAPRPVAVAGGAERCDSVANALAALAAAGCADDDWVLVHDAARPCVSVAEIERLLAARDSAADGALLAVPLADTLKRGTDDAAVAATVPRSGLWRALTPQMFRRGRLQQALAAARAARRLPTDEAEAVEWAGGRVLLVAGEASNLKVTTADDLVLARAILAQRYLGAS